MLLLSTVNFRAAWRVGDQKLLQRWRLSYRHPSSCRQQRLFFLGGGGSLVTSSLLLGRPLSLSFLVPVWLLVGMLDKKSGPRRDPSVHTWGRYR